MIQENPKVYTCTTILDIYVKKTLPHLEYYQIGLVKGKKLKGIQYHIIKPHKEHWKTLFYSIMPGCDGWQTGTTKESCETVHMPSR